MHITTTDINLRIGLLGLGGIVIKDHLTEVVNNKRVTLTAIFDKNTELYSKEDFSDPKIVKCEDIDMFINNIDCCIVALPHNEYLQYVPLLVKNGKFVLKEKPYSFSIEEFKQYNNMRDFNKYVMVAAPRRFNKNFIEAKKFISDHILGNLNFVDVVYAFNIKDPYGGWRGDILRSGGGCVMDMGYHTIDVCCWMLGRPTMYESILNKQYLGFRHDIEHSATVKLRYDKFYANFFITRTYYKKVDEYYFKFEGGYVLLSKNGVEAFDNHGMASLKYCFPDDSIKTQLNYFLQKIIEGKNFEDDNAIHKTTQDTIFNIYKHND